MTLCRPSVWHAAPFATRSSGQKGLRCGRQALSRKQEPPTQCVAQAALTGDDALLVQDVHHRRALAGLLIQRFLEQNSAGDVLAQAGSGDQQLAVRPAVALRVLQADGVQTLAAGGVGFIHGQDSVPRAGHLLLQAPNTAMPHPGALGFITPQQGDLRRPALALRHGRTAVAMSSSS